MLRWFLAVFIGLMLVSAAQPWLAKLGIGRLPGDLRFRLFGREVFLPFTSTVILSLLVGVLVKVI